MDFRKQKGAPHFNDFSLSLCSEVIHFDSDFWSWFDSVRNEYTDGTPSSAVVCGRQGTNSTACSSFFIKERQEFIPGEPEVTVGQHDLDHPAVVIHFPSLECVCDYSNASSISSDRERGGDASLHGRTCRAGDQASWILSVSDLVPGFLHKFHFKWSLADEQLGAFNTHTHTHTWRR